MMTHGTDPQASTDLTAGLEQQLADARRDKTLAQIPALRRLYYVVRVYYVIGLITVLLTLVTGPTLRVLSKLGPTALAVFGITLLMSPAVVYLIIAAYNRFIKQYKRNDPSNLADSARMIQRLWTANLLLELVMCVAGIAFIGLANSAQTIAQTVFYFVLYLVMRSYVRTALQEIPTLELSDAVAKGSYRSWRSLVAICAAISVVVVVGGYLLTPAQ
jgi:hypothetical protein